jgi:hypothetical protein
MNLTSEELEALEKLEKAATPIHPIPSVISESGHKHRIGTTFVFHPRHVGEAVATFTDEQAARAYIATSGAFPALIAAARENANLRAKLADAEKALDEQAEAVRVLAKELRRYADCADELHTCHVDKLPCEACENIKRLNAATRETQNNPTAAAAMKEASGS